jgi:hypothetical protein
MIRNNGRPAGNRAAESVGGVSSSSSVPILPGATMIDAACELPSAGWRVFPCWPAGPRAKSPLTEHGHLDATTDLELIKAWWRRWPYAMIGAAVPASYIVIDIDPRNGGSVADLESLAGSLPATLTVWSGRNDGGRHLYFRRPTGELTGSRLPTGVDMKARGYCIVPPSIHPATGRPYRWEHRPVAPMPYPASAAAAPDATSRLQRQWHRVRRRIAAQSRVGRGWQPKPDIALGMLPRAR